MDLTVVALTMCFRRDGRVCFGTVDSFHRESDVVSVLTRFVLCLCPYESVFSIVSIHTVELCIFS